jgi:hypothetical protein
MQPYQIFLIGYSRSNVNSDSVTVTARFVGPDPFTNEIKQDDRVIQLSDSQMGAKWDEDDILFYVSDKYPMVQVQWLELASMSPLPPTLQALMPPPPNAIVVPAVEESVSSGVEPAPDSTA